MSANLITFIYILISIIASFGVIFAIKKIIGNKVVYNKPAQYWSGKSYSVVEKYFWYLIIFLSVFYFALKIISENTIDKSSFIPQTLYNLDRIVDSQVRGAVILILLILIFSRVFKIKKKNLDIE